METLLLQLVNMSLTAGWLVLAVLLLRLLMKKAPRWVVCLLWALVGIRLVCPFSPESPWSLIPSAQPLPADFITAADPVVDTGMPVVDNLLQPLVSGSLATPVGNSVNRTQVLAFLAVLLWLAGMAAMGLYTLVTTWQLRRRVRESLPFAPRVRLCEGIASPFILGIFRPVVYLPADLTPEQADSVLAHERAHLKRRDHWWKPLGWLLLTVYWFHPLLWVAYVMLCRDIELACDEHVVRTMPLEERKRYSEALLSCSSPRRQIAACPLAFGETGVRQRVRAVLCYRKPAFWVLLVGVVACLAAAVAFLTNPIGGKLDPTLEQLLVQAAEEHNGGGDPCGGQPFVAYTVFGKQTDGNCVTVYGMALYEEYILNNNGEPEVACASHNAFAFTAEKKAAAYVPVEFWTPEDGTAYLPSIREKFPLRYERKGADTQRYIARHRAENRRRAEAYFGLTEMRRLVNYTCKDNGTTFGIDAEGTRSYLACSPTASVRLWGTYLLLDGRLELIYGDMALVFRQQEGGFRYAAGESDAIPEHLYEGLAGYALIDGALFTVAGTPSNSTTVTSSSSPKTTTTKVAGEHITGRVLAVDPEGGSLLLKSSETEKLLGRVRVLVGPSFRVYPEVGDTLRVYYNGQVMETFPPQIYALDIKRLTVTEEIPKAEGEGLLFYTSPTQVLDPPVEAAVIRQRSELTGPVRASLVTLVHTRQWVLDALLDRTALRFDGCFILGENTYYFSFGQKVLYRGETQQVATLTDEEVDALQELDTP